MGHPVECGATNRGLGGLGFEQARRQVVTKDGLEAKHTGFGQRTHMITRSLFPGFPSELANGTQVLIALQSLSVHVAMLSDMSILARWDQDLDLGNSLIETIVDLALVVAAIASKMVNRLIDLLEQAGNHVSIRNPVLGQGYSLDLAAVRVCPDVQLAPGAPFVFAMRSHLPFAFSVDLQASAVHDDIYVSSDLFRQNHLQLFSAPRQGRVVGNWQAHPQHREDRTHKTFRRSVRQVKYVLHRQHDRDGLLAVIKLAAALFVSCVAPALFEIIRHPERNRTALHQGLKQL